MFGFKKKPSPATDPTSILNLLVSLGWLARADADAALEEQRDRLIGQILVQRGLVSAEQLDSALLQQKILRGQIKTKDAAALVLERHAAMHDKIIDAANALKDAAVAATPAAVIAVAAVQRKI